MPAATRKSSAQAAQRELWSITARRSAGGSSPAAAAHNLSDARTTFGGGARGPLGAGGEGPPQIVVVVVRSRIHGSMPLPFKQPRRSVEAAVDQVVDLFGVPIEQRRRFGYRISLEMQGHRQPPRLDHALQTIAQALADLARRQEPGAAGLAGGHGRFDAFVELDLLPPAQAPYLVDQGGGRGSPQIRRREVPVFSPAAAERRSISSRRSRAACTRSSRRSASQAGHSRLTAFSSSARRPA